MVPPRIYYLHPLLAGAVEGWARHLDRCAALGFDHVLVAPPFLPGAAGNVFLTADHHRPHPLLGWPGDMASLLARLAGLCGERGLVPLLDLVADRVAADAPLVRARAGAGQGASGAADGAAADPRRPPAGDAAILEETEETRALFRALAGTWAEAGIAGFRCHAPHRRSAAFWQGAMAAARARRPGCRFLAWTPGLAREAVAGLAGIGFDAVFSSAGWWDFRAAWLGGELAALSAVAPAIAIPEAPFAARLGEGTVSDLGTLARAYRRATWFAAAQGDGWLMPMGYEYAARRPLDPVRDRPEDFAELAAAAPFDAGREVAAANAFLAARGPAPAGAARLLSAPGAPVAAILRREPAQAWLVLANPSLAAPARQAAAALLPRIGAPFARFVDPAGTGGALGPDAAVELAPGEVRVLRAEAAPAVLSRATEGDRAAMMAIEAPRLAIESISPAVDGGAFPVKRLLGEAVAVEADIVCDGHEVLAAALLWRPADEEAWREVAMRPLGNDRWAAAFPLERLGRHLFTIEAWRDDFATLCEEATKKHGAGVDIAVELEEIRRYLLGLGDDAAAAAALAQALRGRPSAEAVALLHAAREAGGVARAAPRAFRLRHDPPLEVEAERRAAAFASWYELFPRSQSGDPRRHGTFDDVIRSLPRIRDMGFDVLYFPPIHPIGRVNRKGRNNSLRAAPGDPGSPYAIGGPEGGHDAIHPELGTLADFRRLRDAAAAHGLELALDFAIQCAPDHPWLKAHPEWFAWRADGSIRYAENPPKKYEDIVNVDFYAPGATPALWLALRDIVLFWVGEGVRLFRVDNPHTKPLPFWQWLIAEVRGRHPDTVFLSEAFTRPKMMYRLAKIGFSQSYTYFTWRHSKRELQEYLLELAHGPAREFFRPHFFVNTPDINPYFLQENGRAGFLIRAALAATLSGLWGVYSGFELCEGRAVPGKEEYLDSEKYEIRAWDWDRPGNIAAEIALLNRIRRDNPALQSHLGITFYNADSDDILYYGKATPARDNVVLVAVNLDPRQPREAAFEAPLWEWGMGDDGALQVEDLVRGTSFAWHGKMQRLRLDPAELPFAIWRVRPMGG